MNIVITGAGGVLCSAFSRALAADGHKIALLDLNLEAAEREAEGIRKAGGEEAGVRVSGPLKSDSGDATLHALHAGLGLARLPDFLVDDDLASGRLEAVLVEWSWTASALHLLTPPGNLRPARVEALIEFLSERLRSLCVRPV